MVGHKLFHYRYICWHLQKSLQVFLLRYILLVERQFLSCATRMFFDQDIVAFKRPGHGIFWALWSSFVPETKHQHDRKVLCNVHSDALLPSVCTQPCTLWGPKWWVNCSPPRPNLPPPQISPRQMPFSPQEIDWEIHTSIARAAHCQQQCQHKIVLALHER